MWNSFRPGNVERPCRVRTDAREGGPRMETSLMGRVLTEATIENLKDLWAVEQGLRTADQARRLTVPDALVDTGATLLSLPASVVSQLGLAQTSTKRVTSSGGITEAKLYE